MMYSGSLRANEDLKLYLRTVSGVCSPKGEGLPYAAIDVSRDLICLGVHSKL